MNGPNLDRVRQLLAGGSGPLILPGRDRRRARRGQLVRNLAGRPLPCCWADCWRSGRTDQGVILKHDAPDRQGDTLTYIFCSPTHREHWLAELEPDRRALIIAAQRERSSQGLIIP